MATVTHSGKTWQSLGIGPNGRNIWPIDEYISGYVLTSDQETRLILANPNGLEEGSSAENIKGLSLNELKNLKRVSQ